MSNKIDCKTKNVIKGHGGTFHSDNWSIYQEDIKVINLCTPKNKVPNV